MLYSWPIVAVLGPADIEIIRTTVSRTKVQEYVLVGVLICQRHLRSSYAFPGRQQQSVMSSDVQISAWPRIVPGKYTRDVRLGEWVLQVLIGG